MNYNVLYYRSPVSGDPEDKSLSGQKPDTCGARNASSAKRTREDAMFLALRIRLRRKKGKYFNKDHSARVAQRTYFRADPVTYDIWNLVFRLSIAGAVGSVCTAIILEKMNLLLYAILVISVAGAVIGAWATDHVNITYTFAESVAAVCELMDMKPRELDWHNRNGRWRVTYEAHARYVLRGLAEDIKDVQDRIRMASGIEFPYDEEIHNLRSREHTLKERFKAYYNAAVGLGIISDTGYRPYFE